VLAVAEEEPAFDKSTFFGGGDRPTIVFAVPGYGSSTEGLRSANRKPQLAFFAAKAQATLRGLTLDQNPSRRQAAKFFTERRL
jgi:hypothetical protein